MVDTQVPTVCYGPMSPGEALQAKLNELAEQFPGWRRDPLHLNDPLWEPVSGYVTAVTGQEYTHFEVQDRPSCSGGVPAFHSHWSPEVFSAQVKKEGKYWVATDASIRVLTNGTVFTNRGKYSVQKIISGGMKIGTCKFNARIPHDSAKVPGNRCVKIVGRRDPASTFAMSVLVVSDYFGLDLLT